ncbi:MAG: peptidylprolyl isomerase [Gammaproteobacteria bacterium]|nr:peptidylprolyl isomerase [Gammaproteobacteria bacterium]
MHIEKDIVVSIHYRLNDDQGNEIENSFGNEPMVYLHGHNNMIPGLEKELEGKQPGDQFKVSVSPEDGYGPYVDGLKQQIPSEGFEGLDPKIGMEFTADTENGPIQVRVLEITEEFVTVDGNHPFAGKTLHFDVDITEIRDATPTELDHGHIHAGGGCCGSEEPEEEEEEAVVEEAPAKEDKPEEGTCCGGCH